MVLLAVAWSRDRGREYQIYFISNYKVKNLKLVHETKLLRSRFADSSILQESSKKIDSGINDRINSQIGLESATLTATNVRNFDSLDRPSISSLPNTRLRICAFGTFTCLRHVVGAY